MTFETILPGEWGSYGGWWVSVYNDSALANAQASEAELLAITQPRVATPPPVAAAQPAATAPPPATTPNAVDQSDAAASQPAAAPAQPVVTTTTTTTTPDVITTYGATPAWTAEEMATARPATPASKPASTGAYPSATGAAKTYAASTTGKVYPRTYDRAGGSYGVHRR